MCINDCWVREMKKTDSLLSKLFRAAVTQKNFLSKRKQFLLTKKRTCLKGFRAAVIFLNLSLGSKEPSLEKTVSQERGHSKFSFTNSYLRPFL